MDDTEISSGMTNDEIEYIRNQLFQYNLATAPLNDKAIIKDINIALRDREGTICGGLIGKIYRFCMFIDVLWISDDHRGSGYGDKLLLEAEKEAIANECRFIHLDTFSFQAPDFYKKNGFNVFGVLDGYPDEIKRYYMKKDI